MALRVSSRSPRTDEHALRRQWNATSAVISMAVRSGVAGEVHFPKHVSKACNETSG